MNIYKYYKKKIFIGTMSDKILNNISTMEILLEDLTSEHNASKFQWMMKELNLLLGTTETEIREIENNSEKKQFVTRAKTKIEQIKQTKSLLKFIPHPINQEIIVQQKEKQMQLMARQDDELEKLGNIVTNIKNISIEIGKELDSHKEILDDMNKQVERTDSSLLSMIRKIKWFKSNS